MRIEMQKYIKRWSLGLIIGCLLVLFGAFTPTGVAADPVTEEWVVRYDGPVNLADYASAMAVDAAGNIYVTGRSNGSGTYDDYATIKYDTDGNELWVVRYNNGSANFGDYAKDIAVDAAGNVYVTGFSTGSGTRYDYATVKYDTNGNEKWVKRYNGPGNSDDQANAMSVDADGNVYVTGQSKDTSYDYATVKYDGVNGDELWVARYNGPGNEWDDATDIAVDAAGNVYVTGYSKFSFGTSDYITVKYDGTTGAEVWVARYDGPGNRDDSAEAIAVDTAGNVYVTGQSRSFSTFDDYATVKYDGTTGAEVWVGRYDGPANSMDAARDIAVDADGNVYVTGESQGSGTSYDYATIKYDTDGYKLWVARYDGPTNTYDIASAMAVDAVGNVYVTGSCYGSVLFDYVTVKYDTDGNEQWVAPRYNGPGDDYDYARAIAVDAAGNVYVTGQSYGSSTSVDYATIKYSQNSCTDIIAAINRLINNIISLDLQKGISNSLEKKLNTALKSLEDENPNNDGAAINSLNAFMNAVEAQRYNHIDDTDADELIEAAQANIDCLSEQ